jgi:hypothetical protein
MVYPFRNLREEDGMRGRYIEGLLLAVAELSVAGPTPTQYSIA